MSGDLTTKDLLDVLQAFTLELTEAVWIQLHPRNLNLLTNALELQIRAQRAGLIPPEGTPLNVEHVYEEDYFKKRDGEIPVKRR